MAVTSEPPLALHLSWPPSVEADVGDRQDELGSRPDIVSDNAPRDHGLFTATSHDVYL